MAAGAAKAEAPFDKIFKLGIVAGAHIAFGAYLAISVGGACPGIAASNPGLQKVRPSKPSTGLCTPLTFLSLNIMHYIFISRLSWELSDFLLVSS